MKILWMWFPYKIPTAKVSEVMIFFDSVIWRLQTTRCGRMRMTRSDIELITVTVTIKRFSSRQWPPGMALFQILAWGKHWRLIAILAEP